MPVSVAFIRELEEVDPKLRRVLLSMLEELERQREESVTKKEFNELKEIVREIGKTVKALVEAQKKTESRMNELEQVVRELAEAQKRTEEEIAKLSRGLQITREQLGGLSRSVGYALENEAYRHLPSILKKYYNIETIERLIRTYINNEEINIFGKAKQDGKEVYLVGEAVLKLDDRSKLVRVWDKVRVVKEEFGKDVVPVLVTHFARPDVLEKAKKAGIIVIQSFEWV